MILADNETKVDLLNNEAIAATIVRLLRDRPDRPVTLGVHGDWGAGKSSILEMIEAGLSGDENVLCLKFNGWRFQGFEDAKIALIKGIVNGLLEKRPALTKATGVVKDVVKRIDWLKLAKKGGGLAWVTITGLPSPNQLESIVSGLEGMLADPARLATKENLERAVEGVKSVLKPAEAKNVPEEIEEFRKAFDKLLKEAGIDQLVVLIDDLDRCLPDTAIETLEAVRLFVFTKRTAFVVAADEAMIEYAVRKHFPDLPDTTGPRDYARNYLEKLIQVPFRIPALGETETRIYVSLLLIGAEVGEEDAAFQPLIAEARRRLARPWEARTLDATTVAAAFGERAGIAQQALALSDQIGPILARGAKGNPRQIKRFLNSLELRQRTAEARGFGDAVKRPVLAKLMLAERFDPRLFEQLATAAAAHPEGRCEDLVPLEAAVGERSDTPAGRPAGTGAAAGRKASGGKDGPARVAVVPPAEPASAVLTEWLSSDRVKSWARVQPTLAGVDLRPYLFVAKDRKDYFGATSALGRLAGVVEQLLGPKLAVQALSQDLKLLGPDEAAQVFEGVRGRIVGGDSFETEPPGAAGLAVLVRTHPTLQAALVDFLESLPPDRCGPWPVGGWEGVLTETTARTRFDRLLDRWSTSTNQIMKTVAAAALRTRRGGR